MIKNNDSPNIGGGYRIAFHSLGLLSNSICRNGNRRNNTITQAQLNACYNAGFPVLTEIVPVPETLSHTDSGKTSDAGAYYDQEITLSIFPDETTRSKIMSLNGHRCIVFYKGNNDPEHVTRIYGEKGNGMVMTIEGGSGDDPESEEVFTIKFTRQSSVPPVWATYNVFYGI